MLSDEDKQWIAATIAGAIAESEQRTAARIEKVETAILTAFHQWASPVEMRLRSHAAALRTLDVEVETISDRVTKLENPPDAR